MIPEQEHIPVCRILGFTKAYKFRQSSFIRTVKLPQLVSYKPETSVFYLVGLGSFRRYAIVLPVSGSHSLDDDIDLIAYSRGYHL